MIVLFLVLTAAFDEDALAGIAHREALEAMGQGNYEHAIGRLQDALRHQPRETDKLLYRDRDGRHKEPYYPHHVWAQVRALQAKKEPAPPRRRELLRDGIVHLDLTSHPEAAALKETLRGELAAVEKALAAAASGDSALAAFRSKIDQLCDREQFEEAARVVETSAEDKARLREMVESRRTAVIARYEKALELTLERVALASPLEDPETIPPLLRAALLPRSVAEPSDGRFAWLRAFLTLCEERLPALRAAAGPAALEAARAFEDSAVRAAEAGTVAGFRAARSFAQAIRWSGIEPLAGGRNDAELERLHASFRESLARCREALRDRKELEGPISVVLGATESRLQKIADRLAERKRFREELARWIGQAEEILVRPKAMADPEALRAAARAFEPLENGAAWETAAAPVRARGLWTRAVLEAVALILEGEAVSTAADRAAPRIRQARALDPDVQSAWEPRLSPKLREAFARIPR